jgi:hypothetical protein
MLQFRANDVRVIFRRPLKKKIDYSQEEFHPNECRWGRTGTMPPRTLLIRCLIYDVLHGKEITCAKTDFELSAEPYMPDWESYKQHPLERAPYPPLP